MYLAYQTLAKKYLILLIQWKSKIKFQPAQRTHKISQRTLQSHQRIADFQSSLLQLRLYSQLTSSNFHLLRIQSLPRLLVGRLKQRKHVHKPRMIILHLLHLNKHINGFKLEKLQERSFQKRTRVLPEMEGDPRKGKRSRARWVRDWRSPTRASHRRS